jgi:FO synthase
VCTSSGVNDLGGTLYQEKITRSAGGDHGERVSLAEFQRRILGAGKIPRLRTTLYQLLEDHVLEFSIREGGVATNKERLLATPPRR